MLHRIWYAATKLRCFRLASERLHTLQLLPVFVNATRLIVGEFAQTSVASGFECEHISALLTVKQRSGM